MRQRNSLCVAALSALALGVAGVDSACSAAPITITPIYGTSITTNQNSAGIILAIQSAINEITSKVATSTATPLNVSIDFENVTTGLGGSNTYTTAGASNISYAQYRAALAERSTSANDATALANLPNTSSFNGSSSMVLTLPLLRSLGYNYTSGTVDSTISLNTGLTNLTRTSIDPSKYDLQTVAMHEIDEVLGVGGGGTTLNTSNQGTALGSMDVFRYSAPGTVSYTTSTSATSYFSINGGATSVVGFNQTGGNSDYADWATNSTHYVQDAYGTPGTYRDLATPELTAYDVIGYTLVPEPMACSLIGLGAIGVLRRRRGIVA